MQTPKDAYRRPRAYIQTTVIASAVLLVLLGLVEAIWVTSGASSAIMVQTGLQRTRVQAIAKDVQVLVYRPREEHAQSVSELQNILPGWEKTQKGLNEGDASLQIPRYMPTEVRVQLTASQSDFIAIDTAAHVILSQRDQKIDPLQVDIIMAHEHGYAVAMSQVLILWQQRLDDRFLQIFWIELVMTTLIFTTMLLSYWFFQRPLFAALNQQQHRQEK